MLRRRLGLACSVVLVLGGCGGGAETPRAATNQALTADGGATLDLAATLGHYERLPVENDWHPGNIEQTPSGLRWINAAGVAWSLTPDLANERLLTGPDCPYAGWPGADAFTLAVTDSVVTGFYFQGELYSRSAPTPIDEVDDTFTDSDGDGVDGTASQLVFVAIDGVDTAGCGTRATPCRTIDRGITIANASGFDVAVSEGTYTERVTLRNGVSVYGGYSRANAWARGTAHVATIASSAVQAGGFIESVHAPSITQSTTLDRFTIASASAPTNQPGISVYGVRIVDAPSLVLKNLIVTAGAGSGGASGAPGGNGASGGAGANGSGRNGGAPGTNASCNTNTVGGWGGSGGADNTPGACGGTTAASHGSNPYYTNCSAGAAGTSANSCGSTYSSSGGDGGTCGTTSSGSPAAPASSRGAIVADRWVPTGGNSNGMVPRPTWSR